MRPGMRRALTRTMTRPRFVVALVGLGFTLLACTAGSGAGTSGPLEPQDQAQITAPTSGLHITASIAAATLGEQCAPTPALVAGDCAAPPVEDGGSSKFGSGTGCGGSLCQQSNVQLSFKAGDGRSSAHVEIVSVTLHDAASGALVDTLKPSKPQAWTGNGYAAWDETIKPAGDLKASYDLSAPAWSTIGASNSGGYAAKYHLHVTLRIDGLEIMLDSTDLNREPMVAT